MCIAIPWPILISSQELNSQLLFNRDNSESVILLFIFPVRLLNTSVEAPRAER